MKSEFLATLFVLVLTALVASKVVNRIFPTLPTSLMSGANAI